MPLTTMFTRQEYEVLEFYDAFISFRGYAPTLDDVAHEFKWTRSGAHYYRRRLEAKGALCVNEDGSIQILKSPNELKEAFKAQAKAYDR